MSEAIEATLSIEMYVDCPNDECGNYINLMDARDTNGYDHDNYSMLLRQMFPIDGENADFECNNVTCSVCKANFDVKGLAM